MRVKQLRSCGVAAKRLPAETINTLFVEAAESVESAVDDSLAEYGPTATMAVIPKGPYVLAQVG